MTIAECEKSVDIWIAERLFYLYLQILLVHTKLDYVFYRTMSRITDAVAFSRYFVETNDT